MKIVVEYVLLENLSINLIVLKTVSLILKEKGRRFLFSAFLGACLTVALPAARLSGLGWVLCEIGEVVVIVCLSFKFKSLKKFVGIFATYFLAAFIYGGACYFFQQAFGINSLLIVLLIVVAVFVIVNFLTKRIHKKRAVENFCCNVELETKGKVTRWKAFLDSGNMLFDPLTNNPVSLINFKVFSTLFDEIKLQDVLLRSEKLKSLPLAHYITFNTLGQGNKILVFQVDKICVDGHALEKPTLGLSLKSFNFGTDIILHNNFAFS